MTRVSTENLHCPACSAGVGGHELECLRCGLERPGAEWPVDPMIGAVLADRYRVDTRLGGGGMGMVYRGTRIDLDGPVAIKLLFEQFAGSVIAERFKREAQVVARLQNPHVVRLMDFGITEEGRLFQVMELVEGDTLEDYLRKRGALDPKEVVALLDQVCEALAEAHAKGIVHRDLKPANIILVPQRNESFVKVLDFGIAGLVAGAPGESKLTQTGMVQGTPHYMSPEQVTGKGRIDHRADIYALGIIAYELLSGSPPFKGETSVEVMVQHVQNEPSLLSETLPEGTAPPKLEALVAGMLAKNPEGRPADVRHVQDGLATVLEHLLAAAAEAAGKAGLTKADWSRATEKQIETRRYVDDEDEKAGEAGAPAKPSEAAASSVAGDSVTDLESPTPIVAKQKSGGGVFIVVAAVFVAALAAGVWFVLQSGGEPDAGAAASAPAAPATASAPATAPAPAPAAAPTPAAAAGMSPEVEAAIAAGEKAAAEEAETTRHSARRGPWRLDAAQRPKKLAVALPASFELRLWKVDSGGSISTAVPDKVEAWFEAMPGRRKVSAVIQPTLEAGRFTLDHIFGSAGRHRLRVAVHEGSGKPKKLSVELRVGTGP